MKDTVVSLSSRLLRLGRKLNALEPLELQERESDAARIELPDGGHRQPMCIHWYGWAQVIIHRVKNIDVGDRKRCEFLRGAIQLAEEHLAELS